MSSNSLLQPLSGSRPRSRERPKSREQKRPKSKESSRSRSGSNASIRPTRKPRHQNPVDDIQTMKRKLMSRDLPADEWSEKMTAMRRIPLFKLISEPSRRALAQKLKTEMKLPADLPIQRGDHAESLWYLRKGKLHALSPVDDDSMLAILTPGSFIGELGLVDFNQDKKLSLEHKQLCLQSQKRACTLRCATICYFFTLHRDDLLDALSDKDYAFSSDLEMIKANARERITSLTTTPGAGSHRRSKEEEADVASRIILESGKKASKLQVRRDSKGGVVGVMGAGAFARSNSMSNLQTDKFDEHFQGGEQPISPSPPKRGFSNSIFSPTKSPISPLGPPPPVLDVFSIVNKRNLSGPHATCGLPGVHAQRHDQPRSPLRIMKNISLVSGVSESFDSSIWQYDTFQEWRDIESLSETTVFDPRTLRVLHRLFWEYSKGRGFITRREFWHMVSNSPLFSESFQQISGRVFEVWDEDHSGGIDFEELVVGLGRIGHGTTLEKLFEFVQMYDADSNGLMSREELRNLLHVLHTGPVGEGFDSRDHYLDSLVDRAFDDEHVQYAELNSRAMTHKIRSDVSLYGFFHTELARLQVVNFRDKKLPPKMNSRSTRRGKNQQDPDGGLDEGNRSGVAEPFSAAMLSRELKSQALLLHRQGDSSPVQSASEGLLRQYLGIINEDILGPEDLKPHPKTRRGLSLLAENRIAVENLSELRREGRESNRSLSITSIDEGSSDDGTSKPRHSFLRKQKSFISMDDNSRRESFDSLDLTLALDEPLDSPSPLAEERTKQPSRKDRKRGHLPRIGSPNSTKSESEHREWSPFSESSDRPCSCDAGYYTVNGKPKPAVPRYLAQTHAAAVRAKSGKVHRLYASGLSTDKHNIKVAANPKASSLSRRRVAKSTKGIAPLEINVFPARPVNAEPDDLVTTVSRTEHENPESSGESSECELEDSSGDATV